MAGYGTVAEQLRAMDREIWVVASDGNSFYESVARQMDNPENTHSALRLSSYNHIQDSPDLYLCASGVDAVKFFTDLENLKQDNHWDACALKYVAYAVKAIIEKRIIIILDKKQPIYISDDRSSPITTNDVVVVQGNNLNHFDATKPAQSDQARPTPYDYNSIPTHCDPYGADYDYDHDPDDFDRDDPYSYFGETSDDHVDIIEQLLIMERKRVTVNADGNSLFRSVASQLRGALNDHTVLRQQIYKGIINMMDTYICATHLNRETCEKTALRLQADMGMDPQVAILAYAGFELQLERRLIILKDKAAKIVLPYDDGLPSDADDIVIIQNPDLTYDGTKSLLCEDSDLDVGPFGQYNPLFDIADDVPGPSRLGTSSPTWDAHLQEATRKKPVQTSKYGTIDEQLKALSRQKWRVFSDGNCMFVSVAMQLNRRNVDHKALRALAYQAIIGSPKRYLEFWYEDESEFFKQLEDLKLPTQWEASIGDFAIPALSRKIGKRIVVISDHGVPIINPEDDGTPINDDDIVIVQTGNRTHYDATILSVDKLNYEDQLRFSGRVKVNVPPNGDSFFESVSSQMGGLQASFFRELVSRATRKAENANVLETWAAGIPDFHNKLKLLEQPGAWIPEMAEFVMMMLQNEMGTKRIVLLKEYSPPDVYPRNSGDFVHEDDVVILISSRGTTYDGTELLSNIDQQAKAKPPIGGVEKRTATEQAADMEREIHRLSRNHNSFFEALALHFDDGIATGTYFRKLLSYSNYHFPEPMTKHAAVMNEQKEKYIAVINELQEDGKWGSEYEYSAMLLMENYLDVKIIILQDYTPLLEVAEPSVPYSEQAVVLVRHVKTDSYYYDLAKLYKKDCSKPPGSPQRSTFRTREIDEKEDIALYSVDSGEQLVGAVRTVKKADSPGAAENPYTSKFAVDDRPLPVEMGDQSMFNASSSHADTSNLSSFMGSTTAESPFREEGRNHSSPCRPEHSSPRRPEHSSPRRPEHSSPRRSEHSSPCRPEHSSPCRPEHSSPRRPEAGSPHCPPPRSDMPNLQGDVRNRSLPASPHHPARGSPCRPDIGSRSLPGSPQHPPLESLHRLGDVSPFHQAPGPLSHQTPRYPHCQPPASPSRQAPASPSRQGPEFSSHQPSGSPYCQPPRSPQRPALRSPSGPASQSPTGPCSPSRPMSHIAPPVQRDNRSLSPLQQYGSPPGPTSHIAAALQDEYSSSREASPGRDPNKQC